MTTPQNTIQLTDQTPVAAPQPVGLAGLAEEGAPDDNGEQHGDRGADDDRLPGTHPDHREQQQQDGDRDQGQEGGAPHTAQRIENLVERDVVHDSPLAPSRVLVYTKC
jgi:hypothetical protein